MKAIPEFSKALFASVIGIFIYVGLIISGPVDFSSFVVRTMPVVLLITVLYLLVCSYFTKYTNKQCFLSHSIEDFSTSLLPWLILSFLLIGCQLVLVWSGEALSFFYMGGLLPNGDGSSYYKGARRLLLEGDLSEWSSRRPFMTAYLASILAISKFSLSATIATSTVIAAFSIALFASAMRRSEPLAVVLWAFVLIFFFYFRIVGTPLSENLGLTFGCIAFVYLWLSADERRIGLFLIGMLFMTLAQVTRSGAVFVLPALIVWGTFWLASGVRSRFVVFVGASSTVITGFLLNRFLLELGGAGALSGFSNFSFTVYGLSVGQGGWHQIMDDYPEIVALTEPARSQGIYALAFDNIISQPSRLFEALQRNLRLYAISNGGLNIVAGTKAWLLVQIPTLFGVIWCIRNIKTPRYAMLLWVFTGVLVSSLIITEDGGLRVFAATVPFSAAIAAIGLPLIREHQEKVTVLADVKYSSTVLISFIFSAVLVSGIFLTMSIVPLKPVAIPGEKVSCSPGARLITITYPARTAIHLRENNENFVHYIPNIPKKDFRAALSHNGRRRDWPNVDLQKIPYSMLSLGKYILLPTSLIINDPPEIAICTERKGWLFIDQRLLLNPL